MPTLDWLNREAAFRTAAGVPTRVLRPHAAAATVGDIAATPGNLLMQGDHLRRVPKEIEKAQVGQVWAAKSNGRAVFAMLFRLERDMDLRQQIDAALG